MTSLRQRMIEDLHLRGYAERTVGAYISAVARLAQYHRTAPDRLSEDQLRAYLLHLTGVRKLARPSLTVALCGIRFFYDSMRRRSGATGRFSTSPGRSGRRSFPSC